MNVEDYVYQKLKWSYSTSYGKIIQDLVNGQPYMRKERMVDGVYVYERMYKVLWSDGEETWEFLHSIRVITEEEYFRGIMEE